MRDSTLSRVGLGPKEEGPPGQGVGASPTVPLRSGWAFAHIFDFDFFLRSTVLEHHESQTDGRE